jgi:hypothetical protein
MGIRERIVEYLRARPFFPFRIILSNGHVHEIRHPELAMVSPYFVVVGVPQEDESSPLIRNVVTVAMIHIMEVEPLPAMEASAKS